MIEKIRLDNILFLDIETVPETADFDSLDDEMKQLWEHKTQYQRKEEFSPEEFYDRAGIWAEFGKIICISVGYFTIKGDIRNGNDLLRAFHHKPTIIFHLAAFFANQNSIEYPLICDSVNNQGTLKLLEFCNLSK